MEQQRTASERGSSLGESSALNGGVSVVTLPQQRIKVCVFAFPERGAKSWSVIELRMFAICVLALWNHQRRDLA
jgi:hypothetical protein